MDRKIHGPKRLEKIRKENVKFEKVAPYNFCDRWCERCDKTQKCKAYQDDFNTRLKHISDGKNPDDCNVALEDVKASFEKSLKMLKKWAEEKDIDISKIDNEQNKNRENKERQLFQHPFYELTLKYAEEVSEFIKEAFYENQEIAPELVNDYETLIWYHTLLLAKAHRLLSDVYAEESGDEFRFYDAVAQIEIIKKSIAESQKALRDILIEKITDRYKISAILDILQDIAKQVETIEEKI